MQETLRARLSGELDSLREKHLYRNLRVVSGEQKAVCVIDGKEVINLSSNNYLGFDTHPYLRQKAEEAIAQYGVGSGAVRTIIGTMDPAPGAGGAAGQVQAHRGHAHLSIGIHGQTGTIGALMDDGDAIISDELNHASIIDGIRLSKAARYIYPPQRHEPPGRAAEGAQGGAHALMVTDGVFSMDGDIATLPDIVDAGRALRRGNIWWTTRTPAACWARTAAARVDHFGLDGRVDIQVGTLSKAIGALGGYVAGVQQAARLPDPSRAAGAVLARRTRRPWSPPASPRIDVLEREPGSSTRLWENTRYFKSGLERWASTPGTARRRSRR